MYSTELFKQVKCSIKKHKTTVKSTSSPSVQFTSLPSNHCSQFLACLSRDGFNEYSGQCIFFISSLFTQVGSRVCCAVLSHSVVSDSLRPHGLQPARLLCSWGFSRQEYWSGLPCPPPEDLPNPGIEPRSPTLRVDSLLSIKKKKKQMIQLRSLEGIKVNIMNLT